MQRAAGSCCDTLKNGEGVGGNRVKDFGTAEKGVAGAGRGRSAKGKDAAEGGGFGKVEGDFKRGWRKVQGGELHGKKRGELGDTLGAEVREFVKERGGLDTLESE